MKRFPIRNMNRVPILRKRNRSESEIDSWSPLPRNMNRVPIPRKRNRTADDVYTFGSDSSYGDPTVDIADLLFTPERDYLVKNNGQKVKVDELKGKAIVLLIFPLQSKYLRPSVTFHMIEAYNELLPLGGVEFIFVPVQFPGPVEFAFQPEAIFNHLFSTLPFPAVPFSDLAACGPRIVETFLLRHPREILVPLLPYWVIIDPTNEVVMRRCEIPDLFKLFGGAELHPLSHERIWTLRDEFLGSGLDHHRFEPRKRLIGKWDQLLASPTRDFLLSSNGDKVPISSLKDKVIGLYFCGNIPHPPHMKMIDKVYHDAKLHGRDLEIVQVNFHYTFGPCFWTQHLSTEDMLVQQCNEKTSWLTLPFKDPSCRKLQRILACDFNDESFEWRGDHLVIIDPRQSDGSGPRFEFSGVKIFHQYGIQGYPFTRRYLYEIERKIREREGRLQSLFPPGECCLIRPSLSGEGSYHVDASELSGRRVFVLFADESVYTYGGEFVSMLQSKYRAQVEDKDNIVDEMKFEVVYVSTHSSESYFSKSVKDMPWLVHPFDRDFSRRCLAKAFGSSYRIAAVAFGGDGEVVAKKCGAHETWEQEFPFISDDTAELTRRVVRKQCDLNKYYCLPDDES